MGTVFWFYSFNSRLRNYLFQRLPLHPLNTRSPERRCWGQCWGWGHPKQPGAPQGQAVVAVVSLQHVASTHGHSPLQTWLWTCLAAWAAALRWGWVSSSGSFSFIFFSLLFPYNPHPHRNVLNNSSSTPVLSPRMSIRRCATRPLSSQSCTLTFCTR